MPNPVRAIPEGYHSISPSLTCKNAARAIEFYKSVFGATEVMRMPGPEGKIMHAELKIGDSIIFVNDEFPGMAEAPAPGVTPSLFMFLYTEDVDSVYNRAVSMGSQPWAVKNAGPSAGANLKGAPTSLSCFPVVRCIIRKSPGE